MTYLLVDGNGIAVRTWWANPGGCADRFKTAIERAMPSGGADVVVCWDSPHSWRRDLFPAYKANRGPKPSALIQALEECRGVFPGWVADGFEADDLLATIARDFATLMYVGLEPIPGDILLVLSDDKDMLQLAGGAIEWATLASTHLMPCLVVNSTGMVYDARAVKKKLGVPPSRIRHLLSWMGDKADGLPGVPGYGPKKAVAKALSGEIGNQLTYELTELATVPCELMRRT